jgi:predicted NAD/FAD-binding protein
MKIAIVGTGISGMVAARLLCRAHAVSVFEAASSIGGHTATKTVAVGGADWKIDTGFIVFNEVAYPNFIRILDTLGVASQPADMSFSISCLNPDVEYCSTSFNTLFAQRRNLLRPAFWRMLRDIRRFFREAREALKPGGEHVTLGEFLDRRRYSQEFLEWHLYPLGAAIWSTDTEKIRACPAQFFVRFFDNHAFLQSEGRSKWRTVADGSQAYIEPLVRPFRDAIRVNCPVRRVARADDGVELTLGDGSVERFDHVVIAAHSNQALAMLADPSDAERAILGAIPYQANDVALHTDASLLPRRRRAWACWNYHVSAGGPEMPGLTTVTYNMNMLQSLRGAPETFCVTLNRSARIDPARILGRYTYDHPLYTPASVAAQARHAEVSGVRRTHYCGAYWGYGFHEDGVRSALAAVKPFGVGLDAL